MKTRQIKMVHAKPLVQYVEVRKLEPEEIIYRISDYVGWPPEDLMKLFKEGEL